MRHLDRRNGIRYVNGFYVTYGRNVLSTELFEASLLGVGTVIRLKRDAWSMVKGLRQATNEYAPSSSSVVESERSSPCTPATWPNDGINLYTILAVSSMTSFLHRLGTCPLAPAQILFIDRRMD